MFASRPSVATISIGTPSTSGSSNRRRTASTSTQIATPNSSRALTNAARISSRYSPNVWLERDRRRAAFESGRQLDGGERHADADHVGQHVAGVGQQRQRVRDEPGDRLDDEEREDDRERDQQASSVAFTGAGKARAVVVIGAHQRSSRLWARCSRDRSRSMRTWASSRR